MDSIKADSTEMDSFKKLDSAYKLGYGTCLYPVYYVAFEFLEKIVAKTPLPKRPHIPNTNF